MLIKFNNTYYAAFCIFLLIIISGHDAFGWYDKTHLAVAKAAGYDRWYNTAAPDIARVKAGKIEGNNHFYNNPGDITITTESVLQQAVKYNDPRNKDGHLYGAVIASLREYINNARAGEYAQFHLDFFVHYVTDLSQPLHNMPYDTFNQSHHLINDGIINKEVLDNISGITRNMHDIDMTNGPLEQIVARETARLANQARHLGNKLKKEQRDMTKEEVYIQLGQSASIIKAVISQLDQKEK